MAMAIPMYIQITILSFHCLLQCVFIWYMCTHVTLSVIYYAHILGSGGVVLLREKRRVHMNLGIMYRVKLYLCYSNVYVLDWIRQGRG